MGMKLFELPYGKDVQKVMLPEERVLCDMHGVKAHVEDDMAGAVREAMRHPIDSRPLAEIVEPGEKVAIVVSDITRLVHTDQFLPLVVEELNGAGVKDEDITIVIATGTHRMHTHEENVTVCGAEMVRRLKIHQHDCRNKDELKYLGETSFGTPVWIDSVVAEADKVIVTGAVSLHPMAGFGGGRKAILPGVAGLESINHNHVMALADEEGAGCEPTVDVAIKEGNRFHEDMTEACAILDPAFLLNVVFTPEGELHEVVAGNWKTAFDKGCADLLKISGVKIPRKADVVIASMGGYPKDMNLYQGTKSYMNAVLAVKSGGIMIQTLECPDIKEPAIYTDWLLKEDSLEMEKELRRDFSMAGFVAFKARCIMENVSCYLVTREENFEFVRQSGQIPAASLEEAWELAQKELAEKGKKDYDIIVMGHASSTLPVVEEE